MPLSDQFAMSFSVAYQRRDGLGDFLLIEDPNKEVGEMQDVSGRIAMQWKPTDNLSFLLTADGNDGENGLRPYDTLIDELGAACRANPPAPRRPAMPPTAPFTTPAIGIPTRRAIRTTTTPARPDQIEVTNKAYGVSLTVDLRGLGRAQFQAARERPPLGIQGRTRRRQLLRRLPVVPRDRLCRSAVGGIAGHGQGWCLRLRGRPLLLRGGRTELPERHAIQLRHRGYARARARPAATSSCTRSTTARRSTPMSAST